MSNLVERPASFGVKDRWQPKKWEPMYEAIVAMSCTGKGAKAIQSELKLKFDVDYTTQHISNILNCDKAEEVRERFLAIMKSEQEDAAKVLGDIKIAGLKRMRETLENKELAEANPFAIFDRALAAVTKVTDVGDAEEKKRATAAGNQIQNNFFNLPNELMQGVMTGLNKANEVKALHSGQTAECLPTKNQEITPLPIGNTKNS
jgi:hypothetical protein